MNKETEWNALFSKVNHNSELEFQIQKNAMERDELGHRILGNLISSIILN